MLVNAWSVESTAFLDPDSYGSYGSGCADVGKTLAILIKDSRG